MATPKKKPPADSRSKNRHKGTFVVRLPESLRTMVEAWSLHNKRTLSAEVHQALEDYFKANPIPNPPASST